MILEGYKQPFDIAAFISDVIAGYDVKKTEEIVYDISIRGLKPVP